MKLGTNTGAGLARQYVVLFPVSQVMNNKFDRDYLEEAAKVFFYALMAGNPGVAMMDLAPDEEFEVSWANNMSSNGDIAAVIRVVAMVKPAGGNVSAKNEAV